MVAGDTPAFVRLPNCGSAAFRVLGDCAVFVVALEAAGILEPTTDAYEKVFVFARLDGSAPGALAAVLPAGNGRSAGIGSPLGDIPIAAPALSGAASRALVVPFGARVADPFVALRPNMLDRPDETGCCCCCCFCCKEARLVPFVDLPGDEGAK